MQRVGQRIQAAGAIIRPPDIAVGGLRFYRDSSSIFLSSFCCRVHSEVAERNSTKTAQHTRFENACPKYGVPFTHRGPKTTFFNDFLSLTATLTAYVFGTKHDIHNRASALQTTRVSYIVSKRHELRRSFGVGLSLLEHIKAESSFSAKRTTYPRKYTRWPEPTQQTL